MAEFNLQWFWAEQRCVDVMRGLDWSPTAFGGDRPATFMSREYTKLMFDEDIGRRGRPMLHVDWAGK
jgi:hypothetical protein